MALYIKVTLAAIYTIAAWMFSILLIAALGSGRGGSSYVEILIGAAIILPLVWSVVHIWRKILKSWKGVSGEQTGKQSVSKHSLLIKVIIARSEERRVGKECRSRW